MVTVLLVNRESQSCQEVQMWLERAPDVMVVGEASRGTEALTLAYLLQPDVVLIDVSTALMDGFLATAALRTSVSKTAVILIGLHDEAPLRSRAAAAGAAAFVGAQEGAHVLLEAIRRAKQQGQASYAGHHPSLKTTQGLVQAFASMVRKRVGERVETGLEHARESHIPELVRICCGDERDQAAAQATLQQWDR